MSRITLKTFLDEKIMKCAYENNKKPIILSENNKIVKLNIKQVYLFGHLRNPALLPICFDILYALKFYIEILDVACTLSMLHSNMCLEKSFLFDCGETIGIVFQV